MKQKFVHAAGVYSVAYAFPKVHLVTTAVDHDINDQFHILPGVGEYHLRERFRNIFRPSYS